jgi:hypothetical protein
MKRMLIAIAIAILGCSPALADDDADSHEGFFRGVLNHTTPDECAKNLSKELPNCWAEWIKFRDERRRRAAEAEKYRREKAEFDKRAAIELQDKINKGLVWKDDCGQWILAGQSSPCVPFAERRKAAAMAARTQCGIDEEDWQRWNDDQRIAALGNCNKR